MEFEIQEIFATAATADKPEAGMGVVWWAKHPPGGYALTALDYGLFDMPEINAEWLGTFFERSAELIATHQPATRGCLLRVEHLGLGNVLKRCDDAFRDTPANRTVNRSIFDIRPVKQYESKKWPATLDERAFHIRPLVDSGKVIKVATGLKRFSFRSIKTNHLISQVKSHRPGDAQSAGDVLHAFILGVLLGATQKSMSYFDAFGQRDAKGDAKPSSGPFGAYIPGKPKW
jgi:hypothetical protein